MIVKIEPLAEGIKVSYPEKIYSGSFDDHFTVEQLISDMMKTSEALNGNAVFHVDAGYNTAECVSFVESCNVQNVYAVKYSNKHNKVLACSKPSSLLLAGLESEKSQAKIEEINALAYALSVLNETPRAIGSSGSDLNKSVHDATSEIAKKLQQLAGE